MNGIFKAVFLIALVAVATACTHMSPVASEESQRSVASANLSDKKSVLVSFYEETGKDDGGEPTTQVQTQARAVISGTSERGLDSHEKWFAIKFKIISMPATMQDFYVQAYNKTQADCIERQIQSGHVKEIMIDQSRNLLGRDFNDRLFFEAILVPLHGSSFEQEYCPTHELFDYMENLRK